MVFVSGLSSSRPNAGASGAAVAVPFVPSLSGFPPSLHPHTGAFASRDPSSSAGKPLEGFRSPLSTLLSFSGVVWELISILSPPVHGPSPPSPASPWKDDSK